MNERDTQRLVRLGDLNDALQTAKGLAGPLGYPDMAQTLHDFAAKVGADMGRILLDEHFASRRAARHPS